ncbi:MULTISPECIES: hypothetical protein [Sorangium]|uniref:hypothetical protein n=1 Tax=Sorangium TaxID=39643 RepID=UPI003D9C48D5
MRDIHPPRDEHRTTGRKLVVLSPTVNIPAMTSALSAVGMDVVVASALGGAVPPETMAAADAVVFDRLHMMVVAEPSEAALAVMNELQARGILLSVEDEGFVYPLSAPGPAGRRRAVLVAAAASLQYPQRHQRGGGARGGRPRAAHGGRSARERPGDLAAHAGDGAPAQRASLGCRLRPRASAGVRDDSAVKAISSQRADPLETPRNEEI